MIYFAGDQFCAILIYLKQHGGMAIGDDEISKCLSIDRVDVARNLQLLKNEGLIITQKYLWLNPELGYRVEATLTDTGKKFIENCVNRPCEVSFNLRGGDQK
jgi:transcription initiation factor IIE alpha subunit